MDKSTTILQGTNPNELPVNFYFDAESGLLVRIVRWSRTGVGIVPTQIDYSDYRDVNGVKLPHHLVLTWTDGQNTYAFKQIRPNVPIEATRFAGPRRTRRANNSYPAAGSTISNTAPLSLRAVIVPPCRSTMALTMDKPRPLPPADLRDASPL